MDPVEDAFIAACRTQGFSPTSSAMRHAAIVLAGANLAGGMIQIPNMGTISAADLAKSIRAEMPEAFAELTATTDRPASGNLTERMRAEVAATMTREALPSDWDEVRRTKTGLTAAFMAEIESSRR